MYRCQGKRHPLSSPLAIYLVCTASESTTFGLLSYILINALTDWYQGYHSYTSMVLPLLLVLYGLVELYMYKYYRICSYPCELLSLLLQNIIKLLAIKFIIYLPFQKYIPYWSSIPMVTITPIDANFLAIHALG